MKIISTSVQETIRIGRLIASRLKPGDIVCLFGQLGSGKTVLTKGIASCFGIDKEDCLSPTFIVVRQHRMKNNLFFYHFDLYRVNSVEEILDLGYEEYFYSEGITVVEWADRLNGLMPKEYLKIELVCLRDSRRRLEISAFGRRYEDIVVSLKTKARLRK